MFEEDKGGRLHPPPKSDNYFSELHNLALSILLSTYLTMANSKHWIIKLSCGFLIHWPLPTSNCD